jgi:hypothetical protein
MLAVDNKVNKRRSSWCWLPLTTMSATMRSDLQGVKEDFDDASPSSKMRCTRFEACEVDHDKSSKLKLTVEDEDDKGQSMRL